jgi:hypothetical protein
LSNIPISSLPIAVALDGSEYTDLVQAGTTKRARISLINSINPANIPAGGLTGQALIKSSDVDYATKWSTTPGVGTVSEIDTGAGLTGGPITLTGTISLSPIVSGLVLANTTGVVAAPTPTLPSAILDTIGSTQGDLLYRNASGWVVLQPGSSGQILTTGGAAANPAWSAVGSGSVQSVALALPSSILTVSGSPVTTTGTLTGTLATQTANTVWAGPTTGAAAPPTFRALVGADLPNPSASTLGGIQSTVGASHQWISSISTSGVPGLTQPAFTDISGTVAAAQLPNPSASTLGGIESLAAVTSKWINQISTSGVPSATQPNFTDLAGSASLAQLPSIGNNAILSNISGGSSAPLANSLSAVIDSAIGNTQGDILYRNSTVWTVLAPGTNGQVLSSGGAAANPSWTTVSGTGTVTSVATNNGLTGGPITASGTIGLATIATGNVLAYTGGGTGVPVATTPSVVLDVIGSTEGNILYRGASTWSVLAPGTAGQHLSTGGAGSTPSWATSVTPSGTPTVGQNAYWTGATVIQGLTPASVQTGSLSPTGTASTTGVMMGLGLTGATITPAATGRVHFAIGGTLNNTTTSAVTVSLRFGTGTAPSNAGAPAGTQIGAVFKGNPEAASAAMPFTMIGLATGLALGTAVWFDADVFVGSGTGTITVACNAYEF